MRRVGVSAVRARGGRVVWEGDVCALRADGDGFGQRGGGSVAEWRECSAIVCRCGAVHFA
jgi:hypothetical protein